MQINIKPAQASNSSAYRSSREGRSSPLRLLKDEKYNQSRPPLKKLRRNGSDIFLRSEPFLAAMNRKLGMQLPISMWKI